MESVEFEALLNDVETRLDRLKALYEQWFQGMERLEPTIARKEVERRMTLLRKEQPRNTALRFRFQQLVQRSTTLQTYWGRVARQIEEGTYRRDLLKARKIMLASRSGRARSLDNTSDFEPIEDGIGAAAELERASAVPEAPPPSLAPPLPPTPARPVLSPIAPPRPVAPGAPAPRVVSPFARPAPRPPNAPAGTSPPLPAQSPLPPTIATFGRPVSSGDGAPPKPATVATFGRPLGESGATRSPPPAAPAAPKPAMAPPATPTQAKPITPSPPLQARPVAPSPPAPARPIAPPSNTAATPTAPRPAADALSEQDVRRVYERYSEARRKNNEPAVAYDTLAKNLRDAAPKMSEKYGKPVDFEVVLKDGKVGLKPVPKG